MAYRKSYWQRNKEKCRAYQVEYRLRKQELGDDKDKPKRKYTLSKHRQMKKNRRCEPLTDEMLHELGILGYEIASHKRFRQKRVSTYPKG